MFSVFGLPAHPLLVHGVVVLLPLAAAGAVAVAARPGWSRPYGPLVAAGALLGALTATAAQLAGNQLAATIRVTPEFAPVIAQHGQFGFWTVLASWPFAILAVAAAVLVRRSPVGAAAGGSGGGWGRSDPERTDPGVRAVEGEPGGAGGVGAARAVAWLAALAGIVAVVVTVLAGHSGSAAVWGAVTGS